jgi:acyl-CoA thioesterase-1
LGANDAFRGINRVETKRNLAEIVRRFREAGARVILARTTFPQLEHPAYTLSMGRAIEEVAADSGSKLIPDLLAGVAGVPALNLEDGIHPNLEGQRRLAETAWPFVREEVVAGAAASE